MPSGQRRPEPSNGQSSPHIRHHPQFIFIDEDESQYRKQAQAPAAEASPTAPFERLNAIHTSWKVRLIALLLSLCTCIAAIAAFILTVLAACAVTLTLGYHTASLQAFQWAYLWCRKLAALALGFAVAVISPPFGFAIILVYFLMLGEQFNHDLLQRLMRSSRSTP